MDEDEDEAEVGMGRLAMYICYARFEHIVIKMEFFIKGGPLFMAKNECVTGCFQK